MMILSALLILVGGYWAWMAFRNRLAGEEQVFCTQEAMLCPDGSYVGRTGPNCEFAPCPGINDGWKKATDTDADVTFMYPEALTAKYISAADWPPDVRLLDQAYNCVEAGSETARAGRTEKRFVDGREYCLTRATEGAAGSNYTQYSYTFLKDDQVVAMTFGLRFVRCENYEETQQGECKNERAAFDIDGLVDRMAQTMTLGVARMSENR